MTVKNENTTSGITTRIVLASIPWVIWMVACFLPAYRVDADISATGWDCFIFGSGALFEFEDWPWVLAWLGNITMLMATVAYLTSFKVNIQRWVAGVGAVMSLLVLRFNFSNDGSSLQIAAFLWIIANLLVFYIIVSQKKRSTQ